MSAVTSEPVADELAPRPATAVAPPVRPTSAPPVRTVAAGTIVAPPPAAGVVARPAAASTGSTAVAKKKSLDIDFGCAALRDQRLEATVERELLEKQLQVAQTWSKVRNVDAATARFKYARVMPGENGEPAQMLGTPAEIEVARCDLRVKEIELKMATLKEDELRVKLRDAWRKEEEEMQTQLATLKHTVETVKLYPSLSAMKPRTTFFFSDCQQEGAWGIGRWYCEVLSERPAWRRYPAEKWFVTKKGTQLWAPLGKVYMDYADQDVYSYCSSVVPGSGWISDKARLAKSMTDHGGVPKTALAMLPTWYVHNGRWSAAPTPEGTWDAEKHGDDYAPPGAVEAEAEAAARGKEKQGAGCQPEPDSHVWFLKETNRNYAAGTFVHASAAACRMAAEPGKNYVVQRHYEDPMLIDGKKFHIRVYLMAHTPAGSTRVQWYLYRNDGFNGGNVAIAKEKDWTPMDVDRSCQITRDRTLPLREWEHYERVWALIGKNVSALLEHVSVKLTPNAKAAWELFGIDLALTNDWTMTCYEINSGPCIKLGNKPMLHDMLDIALPFGFDTARPDPKTNWEMLVDADPTAMRASLGVEEAKTAAPPASPTAVGSHAGGEQLPEDEHPPEWQEQLANLSARFGCGSQVALTALQNADGHAGKAASALRAQFNDSPLEPVRVPPTSDIAEARLQQKADAAAPAPTTAALLEQVGAAAVPVPAPPVDDAEPVVPAVAAPAPAPLQAELGVEE